MDACSAVPVCGMALIPRCCWPQSRSRQGRHGTLAIPSVGVRRSGLWDFSGFRLHGVVRFAPVLMLALRPLSLNKYTACLGTCGGSGRRTSKRQVGMANVKELESPVRSIIREQSILQSQTT